MRKIATHTSQVPGRARLVLGAWIFGIRAKRGFALLIAVIFMSVMLTFGLALGSLAYKQQVIASSGVESQYAFYAADAALECTLYADQQEDLFAYANHGAPGSLVCGGVATQIGSGTNGPNCFNTTGCTGEWVSTTRIPLGNDCADVTVYKPSGAGKTYLFSQGYDLSCTQLAQVVAGNVTSARYASRGVEASY